MKRVFVRSLRVPFDSQIIPFCPEFVLEVLAGSIMW